MDTKSTKKSTREVSKADLDWLETAARQAARSACGVRWKAELEDATSDARLAGYQALAAGWGRTTAAKACKGRALDTLRKLAGRHFGRTSLVETAPLDEADQHADFHAPDPQKIVLDDAGFEGLILLMDDPRDRRMVTAWIRDRETQEVIAEREGICQETASKLIARALGRIKAAMEDDEELMEMYQR